MLLDELDELDELLVIEMLEVMVLTERLDATIV